jgi:hypothetical protein
VKFVKENGVRIKAFRAVDDPELCAKYIEGHERILKGVGVDKVTSSSHEWAQNPAAYVILCENLEGTKVYGGARIHAAGGTQELPLQAATREMDPRVDALVERAKPFGTGEFCGLWNSLEVAGMGIGAIYLIRASIAIISQLDLKTMFALCSPHTARIAGNFGFEIDRTVGDNGTFYYPKLDLLATIVFLADSTGLGSATEAEKKKINALRANPQQLVNEVNRGREIDITYDLLLQEVDTTVYDFGQ